MTDLLGLLNDLTGILRSCPEVAAELDGNVESVVAYADLTTQKNSLGEAVYGQPNGSVLIAWTSTDITEAEPQAWEHGLEIYVRAMRLKSPLALIRAIVDGIPADGDMPWRFLCVNEWVLPVDIGEIARVVDEEGIDYYVIRCAFREKGDSWNGMSG